MKSPRARLFAACLLLTAMSPALHAREIPVKTTAELMAACQNAVPDDEIVIAKGTYTLTGKSRIAITNRPGPVTVRGATGDPADVIIEGAGQDDQSVEMVFDLTASPKWTFRDLTTRNSYYHGFKFNTSSTDCLLRNIVMRDHGESGVKGTSDPAAGAYPDRLTIEKCDIGFTNRTGGTREVVEGIDGVGVAGWIIRDCRFLHIQKNGAPAYAVFTKGNSSDTVIERNRFEDCFIGASFGGGGTGKPYFRDRDASLEHRRGAIRGNTFLHCTDAAIYLNKAADATLEDNTMTGCGANIQLRYPETTAKAGKNTATGNSEPLVRLRDGATLLR